MGAVNIKVNRSNVAVDQNYFWQHMDTCPKGVKVQLLGAGGLPMYGNWDGKDGFYTDWAPLPKKREVTT